MRKPRAFKEPGFYTPVAYITKVITGYPKEEFKSYTAIGFNENIGWLSLKDSKRFQEWLKKAVKYLEYKNKLENSK
jgi:hypothetical protein